VKRKDLISHLEANDCLLYREGGRHSLFRNTVNNKLSAVPRHKEIKNVLCLKICKDLKIEAPKGKWS